MNKEIIMNPDILPTQKEWRLICTMVKQQRELTDEEILFVSKTVPLDADTYDLQEFARAILKKASEK
jgi:hypothetical protein